MAEHRAPADDVDNYFAHHRQPQPDLNVHLIDGPRQFVQDTILVMARQQAGGLAYMRVLPPSDTDVEPRHRLVMWQVPEDGTRLPETEEALYGLEVPVRIAQALYEELDARYGTQGDARQALRQAEDRLEEADAELREAAVELAERTQERDHWEVLCLSKDELVAALETNLADLRAALAREYRRTDSLLGLTPVSPL